MEGNSVNLDSGLLTDYVKRFYVRRRHGGATRPTKYEIHAFFRSKRIVMVQRALQLVLMFDTKYWNSYKKDGFVPEQFNIYNFLNSNINYEKNSDSTDSVGS